MARSVSRFAAMANTLNASLPHFTFPLAFSKDIDAIRDVAAGAMFRLALPVAEQRIPGAVGDTRYAAGGSRGAEDRSADGVRYDGRSSGETLRADLRTLEVGAPTAPGTTTTASHRRAHTGQYSRARAPHRPPGRDHRVAHRRLERRANVSLLGNIILTRIGPLMAPSRETIRSESAEQKPLQTLS
jgi:hypothetical protein